MKPKEFAKLFECQKFCTFRDLNYDVENMYAKKMTDFLVI